jgi:hypothetical protein
LHPSRTRRGDGLGSASMVGMTTPVIVTTGTDVATIVSENG